MTKSILAIMVAALLVFASASCSKQKEADAKKMANDGEAQAAENMQKEAPTDSLAAKHYPIRNPKDPFVTMVTDFGNMTFELYRDGAPTHVDSFLARTRDGFYNGTIFHRIIDNFMIQGGDPKGNGMGGAGYNLKAEFSNLPHQEGTLSMARASDPNSASSQFFIVLARNRGTASLDGKYTIFGQLLEGFDTLHKMGSVPVGPNPMNPNEISKPKQDVYLRKVFVSDSLGNEIK
jgi:cyclophilin family peptidyl-prolyl cis-trans isomerase